MMEPTQGHLTKSLNVGMSSVQKNKEAKLKRRSRTAVATFKEMNSYLLCNANSQARCSNRIIQRIRDLKNDIENGFVQNYLYTEENLLTLQDIYNFFLRNSDLSVVCLLEFVKEHWYDKVRQEDIDERMRAEESESNHTEDAVENQQNGENSLESLVDNVPNGDDLMMNDTKTCEAEDGSPATISLPEGQKFENKLRNDIVKMKIDLEDTVTNKEMNKDKEEVEEERKRKKQNIEEKGSKPKNARKTQKEVKRGLHWECSVCTKGYTRKNLCQDHIRSYHPEGGAQVKKMNGHAENTEERCTNDIISYPNPQQREDESHRDPESSSGLRSKSVEETQTLGHQDALMEDEVYVVLVNSMTDENVTMYCINEDVPYSNENEEEAEKHNCKINEEQVEDLFNVEGPFGKLAEVNE